LKDTAKHQGLRNQLVSVLQQRDYRCNCFGCYKKIPRHLFLNSSFEDYAYQDKAFPIAAGQTISQPAFQSQLLEIKKEHKVLEITGSGYKRLFMPNGS
jgi:protein-L-isoaspartate(D-aspartate) O-methyltransferase